MRHLLTIFLFLPLLLTAQTFPTQQRPDKDIRETGGQIDPRTGEVIPGTGGDGQVIAKGKKPPIDLYKIYTRERDTLVVDTSLSIQKLYKWNYLRRDNFGLLPFANVGQTYTSLIKQQNFDDVLPILGARARRFNYMEGRDLDFYSVPTPLTELYFKTAIEQGQQLDAFLTTNFNRRSNISIAYKGVRSLGNFLNSLTSTGNFRLTYDYETQNRRYRAKFYTIFQDLEHAENGGIDEAFLPFFTSGNEEFEGRERLEVNLDGATNILEGKQFGLVQEYDLVRPRDSVSTTRISVGNRTSLEDSFYRYEQTSADTDFFGDSYSTRIYDESNFRSFRTLGYVSYENRTLGRLKGGLEYVNFNYGYSRRLDLISGTIPSRLIGDQLNLEASYSNKLGPVDLTGRIQATLTGQQGGRLLDAIAGWNVLSDLRLDARLIIREQAPAFNTQLYQSDYIGYNWSNDFDNEISAQLVAGLEHKRWGRIEAGTRTYENFTYFARSGNVTTPQQAQDNVTYSYLQYTGDVHYGKFGLAVTARGQNVVQEQDIYNVPQFVGRASLYFTDMAFKKALKYQIGTTGHYFTSFLADGYDPLLAEFYSQSDFELSAFPRVDFFLNAQVRQTRFFVVVEGLANEFQPTNYLVAPGQPLRDYKVRFGLVWNFFL